MKINKRDVLIEADKLVTRTVYKEGKNTPIVRISRELKWINVKPDDTIVVAQVGDVLVVFKQT